MVRSMTGFGRGTFSDNGKEFTVEIKTVNHRYIDFYIKYRDRLVILRKESEK